MTDTHGSYSPAKIEPLAAEIITAALSDDDCPDRLRRDLTRRGRLVTWARAQATAELFGAWVATLSDEQRDTPRTVGGRSPRQRHRELSGVATRLADRLDVGAFARERLVRGGHNTSYTDHP